MSYSPHYDNSYALVIGINEYDDGRFTPLDQAEQDARDMADLLGKEPYNFTTRLLLGRAATKNAILGAVHDLRAAQPDDRLVIYFSGHGEVEVDRFDNENGYLAPVDAVYGQYFTWLKISDLTELRFHTPAKHVAFILDACFSGQAMGMTKLKSAADHFIERRAYQVFSAGAGD